MDKIVIFYIPSLYVDKNSICATIDAMPSSTKYLLDSGDPDEYREIAKLAQDHGEVLWGSTTNPTLIAKKLTGRKIHSPEEAFSLQKDIVLEIIDIVPGAVSAEVYADEKTPAEDMVTQGREIASWHSRVVVKLPTTLEGFKARTELRKLGVVTNNTLVFSQQQIYAICLHEKLVQKENGHTQSSWPTFISPFVGRLDDRGEDGMTLVEEGMRLKSQEEFAVLPDLPWMLEASVRRLEHMQRGIDAGTELITAPPKIYREWFAMTPEERRSLNTDYGRELTPLTPWEPSEEIQNLETITSFMEFLTTNKLDIHHPLTDKGITQFVADWQALITS